MINKRAILVIFCGLFLLLSLSGTSYGQLENTFPEIFGHFLGTADNSGNFISPGVISVSGDFHGAHFIPASNRANGILTPALNSMIAANVSSFPLSSTSSGVTFDFSTDRRRERFFRHRKNRDPVFRNFVETVRRFYTPS